MCVCRVRLCKFKYVMVNSPAWPIWNKCCISTAYRQRKGPRGLDPQAKSSKRVDLGSFKLRCLTHLNLCATYVTEWITESHKCVWTDFHMACTLYIRIYLNNCIHDIYIYVYIVNTLYMSKCAAMWINKYIYIYMHVCNIHLFSTICIYVEQDKTCPKQDQTALPCTSGLLSTGKSWRIQPTADPTDATS